MIHGPCEVKTCSEVKTSDRSKTSVNPFWEQLLRSKFFTETEIFGPNLFGQETTYLGAMLSLAWIVEHSKCS